MDLIIERKNEFDTKELKVFEAKNGLVTLGVNGKSSKETMWVGITLNPSNVKTLIKYLQEQVENIENA